VKAITLRQPWAWLVAAGIKRIENRGWLPSEPGWIAIHAGHGLDKDEMDSVRARLTPAELEAFEIAVSRGFPRGGIVAVAFTAGFITEACDAPLGQSRWFSGPNGWVLERVQMVDFIPCRGALMLWTPPPAVVAKLERFT
jgi:hypothetical protein